MGQGLQSGTKRAFINIQKNKPAAAEAPAAPVAPTPVGAPRVKKSYGGTGPRYSTRKRASGAGVVIPE